jgi:sugar phosphate permease
MIPLLVQLVDTYDWRVTVALLAAGLVIVVAPLSLLFRHRPEQYGYLPDGDISPDTVLANGGTVAVVDTEPQIPVRQALRTRAFWLLALSFTSHVLVVTAVITHVLPYFSSIGIERTTASLFATAIPLSSIAGRLTFGWISDRFNRWRIAAIGFGLLGAGLACFAAAESIGLWVLVPFLVLFGTGYGGLNVMRASLLRSLFGRKTFGTLFGILMGINMAGSIAGPAVAGWAFDTWGSYGVIWLIFAFVPIARLAITLAMSRGRPTSSIDLDGIEPPRATPFL